MNISSYKIKFKNSISRIVPQTKPYHMCCICLEQSKDVIKCSKCVEGVVCKKCRSKFTENQLTLCPICRQSSDDFIIEIKENLEPSFNIIVRISNHNNKCEYSLSCLGDSCKIIGYAGVYLFLSFLVGMLILQGIFNFTEPMYKLGGFYYLIQTIVGAIFNILLCFCCHKCVFSLDE